VEAVTKICGLIENARVAATLCPQTLNSLLYARSAAGKTPPIQNDDPTYSGGANHISLNEAQQAFAAGQALRPLKLAAYQRWQQQEEVEAAALPEDEASAAARDLALV
jgi:hypothetical protein